MANSVYSVVYRSHAKPPYMARRTLNSIARSGHSFNAENKLTGMLLFFDGMFVQVLEGETVPVLELSARVAADRRNDQLKVLWQSNLDERRFPAWAKGCFDFSDMPVGNTPLPRDIDALSEGNIVWTEAMNERLHHFYLENRAAGLEPAFREMRRTN